MTQTIVTYEPPKANFDFAQEYVSILLCTTMCTLEDIYS